MSQTNDKVLLAKALYELEIRKKQNPLKFIKPLNDVNINQLAFIQSNKKNLVVLGGNRSGKTLMGAYKTITMALSKPKQDIWVATWADLLIPVLMKTYYELLPKNELDYCLYTNKLGFTHRLVSFHNGSVIRFKTYEQGRESFQGTAKDVIHLDEEAPEDVYRECKARLIDRNGVMIRTMTPLNGLTYTYDEIMNSKDPELEYWFWNSTYNPYVDKEALNRIFNSYSEKERIVRQTGRFVNLFSGIAYYSFNTDNISQKDYNPNLPLEIGCDFNISLMSWSIMQEDAGIDYVIDSVELENYANTELLCKMLKDRYPNHKAGWIFYGDISGNQRHPESSYTNWDIIRREFPEAKIEYSFIKNIKDRVDIVNKKFEEKKLFISPNCKRLIMDFQKVSWEMLLNKNKAGMFTHASDGLSYIIYSKHSIFAKPITRFGG